MENYQGWEEKLHNDNRTNSPTRYNNLQWIHLTVKHQNTWGKIERTEGRNISNIIYRDLNIPPLVIDRHSRK